MQVGIKRSCGMIGFLFALSAIMPIYVFIRYPVFISTRLSRG